MCYLLLKKSPLILSGFGSSTEEGLQINCREIANVTSEMSTIKRRDVRLDLKQ